MLRPAQTAWKPPERMLLNTSTGSASGPGNPDSLRAGVTRERSIACISSMASGETSLRCLPDLARIESTGSPGPSTMGEMDWWWGNGADDLIPMPAYAQGSQLLPLGDQNMPGLQESCASEHITAALHWNQAGTCTSRG